MAKKFGGNVIGGWAFLIGVLLALILGFVSISNDSFSKWISIAYVIIGIIIGLLNVTSSESMPFLMSGAILVIVSAIGGGVIAASIPQLGGVLVGLLSIFVPAVVIVAIRNVFSIARN